MLKQDNTKNHTSFWSPLFQKADYGFLLLLILPIFYWLLNSSWAYSRAFYIDPWVYYGHMIRPEYLLQNIPTYSASRMSYILPGIYANQLFSPLVANFVLTMFFYYFTILPLYWTLKITISARTALITSILMGSYLPLLSQIGWNYVDGGGIAYMSLTLLLLTLAAKSDTQQYWSFGAGFGAGLIFHSQIALALFFPLYVAYFMGLTYFYHRQLHWRKLLVKNIIPAIVGFVAITVLLGVISYTFGGSFFFFKWSFIWTKGSLVETRDGLKNVLTNPRWILKHSYLAPIAAIAVGCLLYIYLTPNRLKTLFRQDSPKSIFVIFYLLFVITFLLIELTPFYFLQVFYYTSYLYVPMFLALGILLSHPAILNLNTRQFAILIGGTILVSALAFGIEAWRKMLPKPGDDFATAQILLFLLPTVFFLVIRPRLWSTILIVLSLGFVNYPLVNQQYHLRYEQEYFGIDYLSDLLLAVHDTNTIMKDELGNENIWFWYNIEDAEEPVQSAYVAIASSNLYLYRLVSPEFPQLYSHLRFEPNTNVALLWKDDPTTWDIAIDTLSIYCQEPTILLEKPMNYGPIHFNLTVFRTQWIPGHEFQSDC